MAEQTFSKKSELNLIIEGHQERSFRKVYDVPQKNRHLRREKGRLFKAYKVAKINEDVAGDIKGCLSRLKTRPWTRRSGTPDLKFTKMMDVYILRTWDATKTNVASGDQTDKMIKVRTSLPSEGESIKNKGPSIPLRTEVRPTVWRKTDMVIPTFVISHSLETIVKDVTREVSNNIQGEGKFFDPQVEKSLIMAHVGYWRFNGDGHNHVGRWRFPHFPQTDKDPLATWSRIVLDINSEKAWQILLFWKNARGGGEGVRSRYKLDLEMNPQMKRKILLHPHQTPWKQVTKECWMDRGIMENPGPHRQIMMDETRDKKWGLRKRWRLGKAWTFLEATISRVDRPSWRARLSSYTT